MSLHDLPNELFIEVMQYAVGSRGVGAALCQPYASVLSYHVQKLISPECFKKYVEETICKQLRRETFRDPADELILVNYLHLFTLWNGGYKPGKFGSDFLVKVVMIIRFLADEAKLDKSNKFALDVMLCQGLKSMLGASKILTAVFKRNYVSPFPLITPQSSAVA